MMRALQLAMRMLGREWKSGELGVFTARATVAGRGADRRPAPRQSDPLAVDRQATEVLAADLRLDAGATLGAGYADAGAARWTARGATRC